MSTLDLKVIGQRLQDARNRSGFTQAQVEKHTGINATQLSDYENGERPLGLGVLQTLADLYGYTLQYFLAEGAAEDDVIQLALGEDLTAEDLLVISYAKEFLNNLDFMRKAKR